MARKLEVLSKHTFKIIDDGEVVGTLRVRATHLMWRPKNAKGHNSWHGIPPERFGRLAVRKGKLMDR
jgi:hypothetical protein